MIQSAETLAQHGELTAYHSPMVFNERELADLERRLPRKLRRAVLAQLALRAVPETVPAELLCRTSTPIGVAYVLANRLGLPKPAVAAVDRAQVLFYDWRVSRALNGSRAVIGYQGTSTRTFRSAGRRGVARILDFPIAHYEEVERVLGEEAKRVPAYAHTLQGPFYEPWRKRRYAEEIATADRIIMVSSYHQRTFEAAGVEPSRMFMAHFGVDSELFSPGEERSDGEPFRVLFCGSVGQRKGISYLVDAFKRAELGDAELVFAGRAVGSRQPWIDEPRVRHIDALARPKLVSVYRSADVVVLPSLIEGFPSTPLEGMACGLPAIVSEHTFGHDVIEDGVDGWVTPIRDADAIADKLRKLYEDRDLRRRMGAAARAKAKQFTWTRYGEALRDGIAALTKETGR